MPILKFIFVLSLLINYSSYGQKREGKPNFVVILTDDLTYRAIGYNNSNVKTPNINKLAGKGIIFDRAIAATPICVASRASLLTGLYPQTNGTVALNTNSFISNVVEKQQYKTLAHYLAQDGYSTYFSGKSHLGNPKDYGFLFGEESTDFTDVAAFDHAAEFIKDSSFRKKPFLLWIASRQPHVPLKPDQKWLNLYANSDFKMEANFREKPLRESFFNQGLPKENLYRDSDYTNNFKNLPAGPPRSPEIIQEFTRAYYATISHLDEQVGNLITLLTQTGHLKNTVIIFLSDNGYFLGNHGLGNKITMHEESIRIPFFIYWDSIKNKGRHYENVISSVDVFPTILDMAGIIAPKYIQGKSLKNILLSNPFRKLHDFVASECTGVGGGLSIGHRMVRTKDWKYILSDENDEALFSLQDDPYELHSLIDEPKHNKILSELKQDLKNWQTMVGDNKLKK
ncbi:MAG: sulfatase-like hydrolase/transferase [Chitinophagaceae bacterium]